jgi:flagellin-like hook-associated protein FlgL
LNPFLITISIGSKDKELDTGDWTLRICRGLFIGILLIAVCINIAHADSTAINNNQTAAISVQTVNFNLAEEEQLLNEIRGLAVDSANTGVDDSTAAAADQAQIMNALNQINAISQNTQFDKHLLDGASNNSSYPALGASFIGSGSSTPSFTAGSLIMTTVDSKDANPSQISSLVWSWGDGSKSVGIFNNSTVIGLHVYNASGSYTVTLTITLLNGNTSTSTLNLTIGPAPMSSPMLAMGPDTVTLQKGNTSTSTPDLNVIPAHESTPTPSPWPNVTLTVIAIMLVVMLFRLKK